MKANIYQRLATFRSLGYIFQKYNSLTVLVKEKNADVMFKGRLLYSIDISNVEECQVYIELKLAEDLFSEETLYLIEFKYTTQGLKKHPRSIWDKKLIITQYDFDKRLRNN